MAALADAGWEIREVAPADELPDSAFVEDTVVVCDGLAVLARPGAAERRAEVGGPRRRCARSASRSRRIEEPGTLDGGDVLRVGATVYVGRGGRTNGEGIRQLRALIAPRGCTRRARPARRGAAPQVGGDRAAGRHDHRADPSLLDTSAFPTMRTVPEEGGSHVVLLGGGARPDGRVGAPLCGAVRRRGFDVVAVDISEFEKMEGCVTCLSVLVGS